MILFSIRSNKPPGALGVDTITMNGSDFAMYLSDNMSNIVLFDSYGKNPLHLISMNFGLVNDGKHQCGYRDRLQSNSRLIQSQFPCYQMIIPAGSNKAFIRLISLIANSWLGPVTITICELL